MGRPPKPTGLHVLHGSFRKDRHGRRSDNVLAPGRPEPLGPFDNEDAEKLWNHVCEHAAPWLTPLDGPLLYIMADLWGMFCKLAREGDKGDPKRARLTLQLSAEFSKMAAKFGMTPSDRARLPSPPPPTKGVASRKRDVAEYLQ